MSDTNIETTELPTISTLTPVDTQAPEQDPTEAQAYEALKARRAERRRKTLRRRALIACSLAAIIGVSLLITHFAKSSNTPDDGIGMITDSAYLGNFSAEVSADGKLKPINSTVISPSIEGTVASIEVSIGQYVNEGDLLMTIKNDDLDYAINTQWSILKDTKAAYESLVAEVGKDDPMAATALRECQSAQREYDQAVALGNQRKIYAPCAGNIVALNAQVGSNLANMNMSDAASGLMQIADLSQMTVQIEVGEEDIAHISRDQIARVSFSAFPDLELEGKVIDIASTSTASAAGGYDQGGEVTYSVIVLIAEPDERLKPGMTAHANLITESYDNVIIIPSLALLSDDGESSYVYKLTDAETQATEKVFVDVITQDDSIAVIGRPSEELPDDHPNKNLAVSPLADGDEIVLSGFTPDSLEGDDSEMMVY